MHHFSSRDDEGKKDFKKEVRLLPVSAGTTLEGEAKIEFEHDGKNEQLLEVEIDEGQPAKEYRVLVTFGAAGTVDFGPFVAEGDGEADIKFSTKPSGKDRSLTPLLPSGKDIRDVTKIQITDSNKVVILDATL